MKSIFIGFDFSMNKPACTILYDKQFYFFIWPIKLKPKVEQLYNDNGVFAKQRNLEAVSTKDKNSQIILEHTIRSTNLANLIIDDLNSFFIFLNIENTAPIYVASEGLSYGSKGDAALNLATYKGVLMSKLYEHFYGRMYGLYTYPPITIKSVAGCAKKGQLADKNKMIQAFLNEKIQNNKFFDALKTRKFINRTKYIQCIDDIVDSYWALKTMLKKEGFIK